MVNYMRSALVSAHGLKNEVYHSIQDGGISYVAGYAVRVPRSQPITLLRHFEFIILIIFRVPRSRLRGIYFEWRGIL